MFDGFFFAETPTLPSGQVAGNLINIVTPQSLVPTIVIIFLLSLFLAWFYGRIYRAPNVLMLAGTLLFLDFLLAVLFQGTQITLLSFALAFVVMLGLYAVLNALLVSATLKIIEGFGVPDATLFDAAHRTMKLTVPAMTAAILLWLGHVLLKTTFVFVDFQQQIQFVQRNPLLSPLAYLLCAVLVGALTPAFLPWKERDDPLLRGQLVHPREVEDPLAHRGEATRVEIIIMTLIMLICLVVGIVLSKPLAEHQPLDFVGMILLFGVGGAIIRREMHIADRVVAPAPDAPGVPLAGESAAAPAVIAQRSKAAAAAAAFLETGPLSKKSSAPPAISPGMSIPAGVPAPAPAPRAGAVEPGDQPIPEPFSPVEGLSVPASAAPPAHETALDRVKRRIEERAAKQAAEQAAQERRAARQPSSAAGAEPAPAVGSSALPDAPPDA